MLLVQIINSPLSKWFGNIPNLKVKSYTDLFALINLPVKKVAACASYISVTAFFKMKFNLFENCEKFAV